MIYGRLYIKLSDLLAFIHRCEGFAGVYISILSMCKRQQITHKFCECFSGVYISIKSAKDVIPSSHILENFKGDNNRQNGNVDKRLIFLYFRNLISSLSKRKVGE